MSFEIPLATSLVMSEVAAERARQDVKWGVQNHPLVDELLRDRPHTRMAEEYEVPTALRATMMCQTAAQRGQVTWMHILIEEVCEFMGAAQHDPVEARAEMVQVAAVAVAIIEAIDRRGGRSE